MNARFKVPSVACTPEKPIKGPTLSCAGMTGEPGERLKDALVVLHDVEHEKSNYTACGCSTWRCKNCGSSWTSAVGSPWVNSSGRPMRYPGPGIDGKYAAGVKDGVLIGDDEEPLLFSLSDLASVLDSTGGTLYYGLKLIEAASKG